MIQKAHFRSFRTNETIQFIYDATAICNKLTSSPIAPLVVKLIASNQLLDQAFKLAQGSAYTNIVEELDTKRDSYLSGIKLILEGYTHHFNPEKANAASELLNSININGDRIVKENYQAETRIINSILNNWETNRDLITTLSTLQLNDWAIELRNINTQFEEAYLNRNADISAKPQTNTVELTNTVVEDYRKLTANIEAHATLSTTGEFNPTITELNNIIDKYNRLAQNRIAAAKAKAQAENAKN